MRAWLGVPSLAFVTADSQSTPSLFVYYQAESNHGLGYAYDATGTATGVEAVTAPPFKTTVASALSTSGADTSASDYDAAIARSGSDELRGVWAKRIDVVGGARTGSILDLLGSPTAEDTWTQRDAVPGELLGRVRVWVAQPGHSPNVRRFESAFNTLSSGGVEYPPWLADPVAVTAGFGTDAEQLCLYFAANPDQALTSSGVINAGASGTNAVPNRHGLWRGAAVPEDTRLAVLVGGATTGTVFAVLGRDFVVRPPGGTDPLGDCVKPSSGPSGYYWYDPDPVELPDGSWRVYSGHNFAGGTSGEVDQALRLTWGTAEAGSRPWSEAWSVTTVLDFRDTGLRCVAASWRARSAGGVGPSRLRSGPAHRPDGRCDCGPDHERACTRQGPQLGPAWRWRCLHLVARSPLGHALPRVLRVTEPAMRRPSRGRAERARGLRHEADGTWLSRCTAPSVPEPRAGSLVRRSMRTGSPMR